MAKEEPKVCPYCGARGKKSFSLWQIIVAIVSILYFPIGLVVLFVPRKWKCTCCKRWIESSNGSQSIEPSIEQPIQLPTQMPIQQPMSKPEQMPVEQSMSEPEQMPIQQLIQETTFQHAPVSPDLQQNVYKTTEDRLRDGIESLYGICDYIDSNSLGVKTNDSDSNLKTRDVLRKDLVEYLFYLGGLDQISQRKSEFVIRFIKYDLPSEEVTQFISNRNMDMAGYRKSIPMSVQIFAELQNHKGENGYLYNCGRKLLAYYEFLGREYISCDGDEEPNFESIYRYLEKIEKYINKPIR